MQQTQVCSELGLPSSVGTELASIGKVHVSTSQGATSEADRMHGPVLVDPGLYLEHVEVQLGWESATELVAIQRQHLQLWQSPQWGPGWRDQARHAVAGKIPEQNWQKSVPH